MTKDAYIVRRSYVKAFGRHPILFLAYILLTISILLVEHTEPIGGVLAPFFMVLLVSVPVILVVMELYFLRFNPDRLLVYELFDGILCCRDGVRKQKEFALLDFRSVFLISGSRDGMTFVFSKDAYFARSDKKWFSWFLTDIPTNFGDGELRLNITATDRPFAEQLEMFWSNAPHLFSGRLFTKPSLWVCLGLGRQMQ